MRLIKIQFTSWRDGSVAPPAKAFQEKFDWLAVRENALSSAAATIKGEQARADSDAMQKALARIAAQLRHLTAERIFLIAAEQTAAEEDTRAATEHPKVGTFGYQVFSEPGHRLSSAVDETGKYLPAQALYTFDVVDEDPPLPQWAEEKVWSR